MATLKPGCPPEFRARPGEAHDVTMNRRAQALEALEARAADLPAGEIVGGIVKFGVADGYAYYRVTSEKPLVLQHLPIGDLYEAPASLIRGLRVAEVRNQVEFEQNLYLAFRRAPARANPA